jgi:hypothetical protein
MRYKHRVKNARRRSHEPCQAQKATATEATGQDGGEQSELGNVFRRVLEVGLCSSAKWNNYDGCSLFNGSTVMTPLESLVADFATSQRLKEAGFPQDTAMAWYPIESPDKDGDKTEFVFISGEGIDAICAAPTAGEMEEWLREKLHPTEIRSRQLTGGTLEYTVWWIEPENPQPLREKSALGKDDTAALTALVLEVAK